MQWMFQNIGYFLNDRIHFDIDYKEYVMTNTRRNRSSIRRPRIIDFSEFLRILYRDYSGEQARGIIEIRPIKGRNRPSRSLFSTLNEINQLASRINELNRQGFNIYFSVNPRPRNKNKKQKFIKDIVCLWLDVDAKNFDGGKEEAFRRLQAFPLQPNIMVDSGNGYHSYWILEEPIINRTEEQSLEIKQILNGLINTIGADRQRKNFDSVMRLPGTLNVKEPENPLECTVKELYMTRYYSLSDFRQYRDMDFSLQDEEEEVDLNFEGVELLVRNDSSQNARRDVQKLKVNARIKKMIIAGTLQSEEGKDKTKSGRDQAIITALIAAGYTFNSVKSIFFNNHLRCSDRINGDLNRLLWDVKSAIRFLEKRKRFLSPSERAIFGIENSMLKSREKIRAVRKYIIKDLIKGDDSIGSGYKNKSRKIYYFFDKEQKLLIDTDGEDFKYFLVNRYGLLDKDLKEIIRAIQAAIYEEAEEIEPHDFTYYDRDAHILYISDHDNQVYKLNGSDIEIVDNGTDGVIFGYKSDYVPFSIDASRQNEVLNYFRRGFSWRRFSSSASLLHKYLIERANFSTEETHDLSVEDQKYILAVYFYSLFFESLQSEKPILCFVGVKSSGKSFVATSIGKILFGDTFFPNHLSDSLRDFKVILSENRYVVFDNLDSNLYQFMDAFCAAATGAEISSRKLFTDREEIKTRPRIFIVITSREPKFRRDDIVDRLILLNTELVREPMSRSTLFKELDDNREMIMTEILVNLNSIVRSLRRTADWNPTCIFRIADWELFGKRVHSPRNRENFINILKKMNKEKSKFGLEEDPLYILLKHMVYDRREQIIDKSASELYEMLLNEAEDQRMKDFSKRYKSSISLGRRLANIKEELRDEFDFQIRTERMRRKVYSFKAKEGEGGEDNQ